MRIARIALATAAGLALWSPAVAQDTASLVTSRVRNVTVYEDRALVTRAADVSLADGLTRVAIEGLPPGLDPASLRARTSGAQVLGVEFEAVHRETTNDQQLRDAEARLLAARTRLREVEMAIEELAKERETLLSIRANAAQQSAEGLGSRMVIDTEAIGRLLDFVRDRVSSLGESIRTQEAELVARKAAVDAAAAALRELQGAGTKEVLRAVVTLRGNEGTAPLELSYIVPGATWRPVYALRVDGDFGSAALELSAEISQRTGEDWTGVDLEVTTARPAAGAAPPTPQPWHIHLPRAQPEAVRARRSVGLAAPAKAEMLDAVDEEQSGYLDVRVRSSSLVVAFESHRKETVRSGARPARVGLGTFALAPDVTWTVFPRATTDVFVTAELTNTTGVALPAGETRVFVGPDYVGPMVLQDWGIDEKTRVGLGVDRQVEAERVALVETRGTEGVFSKDAVHTRRYRITLKNHRQRQIAARILDQVPVSGDEELVVEMTESSLAQATLPKDEAESNTARGVLEWRPNVAAGTTFELRFGFEVRHPEDEGVIGLD